MGQNFDQQWSKNGLRCSSVASIVDRSYNCSPNSSRPSTVIWTSPTHMPKSSVECHEPGVECCELCTGVSSDTGVAACVYGTMSRLW
jgi:hypothetical protein